MDIAWPLGPRLKVARESLKLSKRAAARRARISEQLWRRLETGYYTVQGERIPLAGRDGTNRGATADTVRAVALAVGLDVREALALVGYPEDVFDKGDPVEQAEEEFRTLYATFEKAWGAERAREAMRRVWRDGNDQSTSSPGQANGPTQSASG